jgi:hypothetical protein
MTAKEMIINDTYFSEGGYGSVKETLKDAKEKDPTISLKHVQSWKEKIIPRKTPLRGFDSYVAPGPLHQFQVDLFVYKFEQRAAQKSRDREGTYTQPALSNTGSWRWIASRNSHTWCRSSIRRRKHEKRIAGDRRKDGETETNI